MSSTDHPALRLRTPIDARPIIHGNRRYTLLRDPLGLTTKTLLIPEALTPALGLLDGTRDAATLRGSLAVRFGLLLPASEIENLLQSLDDALLLDNERFTTVYRQALQAYRQAPARPLSCAPHVYPTEPERLHNLLEGFRSIATQNNGTSNAVQPVRGLLSPHIDYARGGPVYAQVWEAAREAAQQAELVVIFGTDHFGGEQLFTLTRQDYSTPYGSLPTSQEAVSALAQVIGEEDAFAGEIRHRGEHSVELAAVWLHHIRGGEPVELLPVLCGSFSKFLNNHSRPQEDETVQSFLRALKRLSARRKTLVVAAGDLSHVGPAFGSVPLDQSAKTALRHADQELINRMQAGDAEGFYDVIQRQDDRNNVCGLAPIYLTLRALERTRGHSLSYDMCPADKQNTSVVSIAGVLFK